VSFRLSELYVDITGRDSSLRGTLNRVEKHLTARAVAMGTMAGNAMSGAISKATDAIGGLYNKVIGGASDLAETTSKLNVVFGEAAKGITATADDLANKFGLPKKEILDGAAAVGLLGKAAGQSQGEAAELGSKMVKLAADASSFYNVPLEDALEKIRAGLTGESEPLRAFGVLLSEAAVKQEALTMGLIKGKEEMTEGQKVQARASIIARQLKDATGDLGRTSGGYANQAREFGGRLSNMFAELGMKLLPAATAIMKGLNTVLQDVGASVMANMPQIEAFGAKLAQLGPVISAAWKELPTTIALVGSAMKDIFTNALIIGQNVFVGLGRFAGDIFEQVGRNLGINLENAIKDVAASKAVNELVYALTLGQVDTNKLEGMNMRRQTKAITPNAELLGNPLQDVGFSDKTKGLFNKMGEAAKEAEKLKLQQEQLEVQKAQLAEQKKGNANMGGFGFAL
jgi:hypothetical protein